LKELFGWLTQNHAWRKAGYLAIFGIAVYLILPQITALENSWQVLISMALWAVGLAFISQVFSYLGSGFMLQSILAIAHQKVSLGLNTLIVLGSTSIGMVAGGTLGTTAAIYRWTSGGEGSMEGATLASIFLPQFNLRVGGDHVAHHEKDQRKIGSGRRTEKYPHGYSVHHRSQGRQSEGKTRPAL
jgi:uncharacterized membrane protein YbhN (UPF0104 family)